MANKAPTTFNGFTYDIGDGPKAVPGANLNLTADNAFHEWQIDLGSLAAIENLPLVTFAWSFDDLVVTPAESFRIDHLEISATRSPSR